MIFARNLIAFLLGVAFQVLAGVFPHLAGVFIGPASLLLSASDIRKVIDGSFVKHVTLLALGMACQIGAVLLPATWNAGGPLLGAGGILIAASDIRRILKGQEEPAAPIVTPDAVASASAEKGPVFPPPGPIGPIDPGGVTQKIPTR